MTTKERNLRVLGAALLALTILWGAPMLFSFGIEKPSERIPNNTVRPDGTIKPASNRP